MPLLATPLLLINIHLLIFFMISERFDLAEDVSVFPKMNYTIFGVRLFLLFISFYFAHQQFFQLCIVSICLDFVSDLEG
jgi:hypothetical protein